jgi:uroporphyrinogen decarboxylase
MIRTELRDRTALLGFAGSPWTLANYMIEGGGVRGIRKRRPCFTRIKLFAALMDKLTDAVAGFLQLQIDAGADAADFRQFGREPWGRQLLGSFRTLA